MGVVGNQRKLEALRERQVFHILPQLLDNDLHDSELPESTHDPILTALAQLAAHRLGVRRCLVSLFDRRRQLVIAEATKTSALTASARSQEEVWLGGTAIPRRQGICEHVLLAKRAHKRPEALSVSVVPDLALDPRFCDRSYISNPPFNRFYAGVPLVSTKGVRFGVLCVFDESPRPSLDHEQLQFLRDLSQTVTSHLESHQAATASRRSERMVRGLGSFFKGNTGNPKWQAGQDVGPVLPAHQRANDDTTHQQILQKPSNSRDDSLPAADQERPQPVPLQSQSESLNREFSDHNGDAAVSASEDIASVVFKTLSTNSASTKTINTLSSIQDPASPDLKAIFSRAANIIRDSVEVEGVVFLDACISSFGGLVLDQDGALNVPYAERKELSSSMLSEDSAKPCHILGYSTNNNSSLDRISVAPKVRLSEKMLLSLLHAYPSGMVFHFDEDGTALGGIDGDPGSEDGSSSINSSDDDSYHPSVFTPGASATSSLLEEPLRQASRSHDYELIALLFPGARSVALVPLWDARKEQWFAGSFMWTKSPARCFEFDGDVGYLRAFATSIMSDVGRLAAFASERAKSDLLGSLSHELRSPLHGITGAVELLHDTELSAFQAGLLQTMEICGRTLLDVFDHLLDYSKLNALARSTKTSMPPGPEKSGAFNKFETFQSRMSVLSSTVELDVLMEETVESVFSGSKFQSIHTNPGQGSDIPRRQSLPMSDSGGSSETSLAWGSRRTTSEVGSSGVSIFMESNPHATWSCQVEAGAFRRLIMNLVGNALKYTDSGCIKVSMKQEQRQHKKKQGYSNHFLLSVSDSGKGIDPDFLRNRAFLPFSQEDVLSQGTGLGLSLVKDIVQGLNGSLHIESQLQQGTCITVSIPLRDAPTVGQSVSPFWEHVNALRGLRIALYGFRTDVAAYGTINSTPSTECDIITAICRDLLRLNIIPYDAIDIRPDIILCGNASAVPNPTVGASLPPVVVICDSALTAHDLLQKFKEDDQTRTVETVSYPIGSRKLANALVLALGRDNDANVSELVQPISTNPRHESFIDNLSTPDVVHGSEFPFMADGTVNLGSQVARAAQQAQEPCVTRSDLQTKPFSASSPTQSTQQAPAEPHEESLENGCPSPQTITNVVIGTPRKAIADDSRLPPNTSSKRVLLVDDNNINLQILVSFLKKLGHAYDTATNGLEALEAFMAAGPDAFSHILMDISMPVMDGLESTRRIRQAEASQSPAHSSKIIALTGLASAAAQKEAFASGIDMYMMKPVRFKDLERLLVP